MSEEVKNSRRGALKKVCRTAAFAIPSIATFNISVLKVDASVGGKGKISARVEFPE